MSDRNARSATYDAKECERLCREAKKRESETKHRWPFPPSRVECDELQRANIAMADHLEAAGARIASLESGLDATIDIAASWIEGSPTDFEKLNLMRKIRDGYWPPGSVKLKNLPATSAAPIVALVREYFSALDGWAEHPTDDAHTRLHAADIALRREAGCDAVHVMKVAER